MSSLIGVTSLTLLASLVITATIGAVIFSPLLMMLAMVSFIVWMAILIGIVAFQYRRRTRLKGRLDTLRNAATLSSRRDQWRFFAQTDAREYMPRSEIARLDFRSKPSTTTNMGSNAGSNAGSMRNRVSPGIQLPPDDGLPFEHDTYRVPSATRLYSRSPSPAIDFAGGVDEAEDADHTGSGVDNGDNQLAETASQDNPEDGDQYQSQGEDQEDQQDQDLTQDNLGSGSDEDVGSGSDH